jgi:hypothetical protein
MLPCGKILSGIWTLKLVGSLGSGTAGLARAFTSGTPKLNVHALEAAGELPRETTNVTIAFGGTTQRLQIARVPGTTGGSYALWVCECGARRRHLYLAKGRWTCRSCGNLAYASRHINWGSAFLQVVALRRRLGADPHPFAPLPPRPRRYPQHARYDRLARQIALAEAAALGTLGKLTVAADRRRDGKLK